MFKFFKEYPKMAFLLIGFIMGFSVAGLNSYYAGQTIKEFKEIAHHKEEQYEELISKHKITIATLSKQNQQLKQHVVKKKVTKADGTIVETEVIDTDSKSASENSTLATEENETNSKKLNKKESLTNTYTKETINKFNLGIGYNTDRLYYFHFNYSVFGPLTIGGGATQGGTLMFNLGVNF